MYAQTSTVRDLAMARFGPHVRVAPPRRSTGTRSIERPVDLHSRGSASDPLPLAA